MSLSHQSISNPAGFWIRLAAVILDGIVVSVPLMFIVFLVSGRFDDNNVSDLVSIFYSILVPVLWYGYTVGKRVVHIRIVKVNGEKVGLGTMLLRVLVAGLIDAVTLGIAVIVSAFMVGLRKDKRAIHDFIAGTYVTYDKP